MWCASGIRSSNLENAGKILLQPAQRGSFDKSNLSRINSIDKSLLTVFSLIIALDISTELNGAPCASDDGFSRMLTAGTHMS
jgi:hypothetical protein